MPIAHCMVTAATLERAIGDVNPVALWASAAGLDCAHMTLNILSLDIQYGKPYDVMAHLLLPSLWSANQMDALQLGLARALGEYFSIGSERIQVCTTLVESGRVVEAGELQHW